MLRPRARAWRLQALDASRKICSGYHWPRRCSHLRKSKTLYHSMINFFASQDNSSSNLGGVAFHDGADGSLIAQAAFAHGNPAITVGNNVANWTSDGRDRPAFSLTFLTRNVCANACFGPTLAQMHLHGVSRSLRVPTSDNREAGPIFGDRHLASDRIATSGNA